MSLETKNWLKNSGDIKLINNNFEQIRQSKKIFQNCYISDKTVGSVTYNLSNNIFQKWSHVISDP